MDIVQNGKGNEREIKLRRNQISETHNSFSIIFRLNPHKNANINQNLFPA